MSTCVYMRMCMCSSAHHLQLPTHVGSHAGGHATSRQGRCRMFSAYTPDQHVTCMCMCTDTSMYMSCGMPMPPQPQPCVCVLFARDVCVRCVLFARGAPRLVSNRWSTVTPSSLHVPLHITVCTCRRSTATRSTAGCSLHVLTSSLPPPAPPNPACHG